MAFRHTEFSYLVATDPKAAVTQLRPLFKANGHNVPDVAKHLGVNRYTLFRWLKKLADQGAGDPRDGKRGRSGRKVAA